MRVLRLALIPVAQLAALAALAAQPAPATVQWGGFLDAYVAHDFTGGGGRVAHFEGGRPLLGIGPRHHAPGLNLALAWVSLHRAGVGLRLAAQAGSAVDTRAVRDGSRAEPWLRALNELSLAVRPGGAFRVEAGIAPSHLGVERWMSHMNPTYTRSLLFEFAPWQQAGVRAGWTPRPWLDAQAVIMSGWSYEGESFRPRGVGGRIDLWAMPGTMLRGYNMIVRLSDRDRRLRRLHGFAATVRRGPLHGVAQVELGSQENSSPPERPAHWWGYLLVGHLALSPRTAAVVRFERFDDDKQIVLRTGGTSMAPNAPFRGYGESAGFDFTIQPGVMWRTEARAFQNSGPAFSRAAADAGRSTAMGLTSLVVTF
jgi:hypothetical protein